MSQDEIEQMILEQVFEQGEREGRYQKVRDEHGNVVLQDGMPLYEFTAAEKKRQLAKMH
jgi:hypothetical protein